MLLRVRRAFPRDVGGDCAPGWWRNRYRRGGGRCSKRTPRENLHASDGFPRRPISCPNEAARGSTACRRPGDSAAPFQIDGALAARVHGAAGGERAIPAETGIGPVFNVVVTRNWMPHAGIKQLVNKWHRRTQLRPVWCGPGAVGRGPARNPLAPRVPSSIQVAGAPCGRLLWSAIHAGVAAMA